MRLILLGPPGCGKGTQAKLLCQKMALEHIATGDLLRAAIRQETPTGRRAKGFVEVGQLVPDEVVNELIAERFARDDRPSAFVMDGYPRTLAQALSFEAVLSKYGLPLDRVVLLTVSDEEIMRRVTGRWSCPTPACKATYHVESNPPKVAEVCDDCGARLIQRADDKPETVKARLTVYHRDTVGLIRHYQRQALLAEVSGTGSIDKVFADVQASLQPRG